MDACKIKITSTGAISACHEHTAHLVVIRAQPSIGKIERSLSPAAEKLKTQVAEKMETKIAECYAEGLCKRAKIILGVMKGCPACEAFIPDASAEIRRIQELDPDVDLKMTIAEIHEQKTGKAFAKAHCHMAPCMFIAPTPGSKLKKPVKIWEGGNFQRVGFLAALSNTPNPLASRKLNPETLVVPFPKRLI